MIGHSATERIIKITENPKSFSLLSVVLGGAVGWPQASLAEDTIAILYEVGEPSGLGTSDWLWLLSCVIALFLGVILLLNTRHRRQLTEKSDELERSQERLSDAQRIAHMGSWSRDFESGATFWSKEARMVLGLDASQEALKHYETLIHPDDIEKVTETVAVAYHQGGNYQCDHRIRFQNSQEKYIRLAGQVFLGDGNSPVREIGTVQDITDRKLAEFAYQRSEERMRSILDAAPYPILIIELTDDYPILYANRNAYALFGISESLSNDEIKSAELWAEPDARTEFVNAVINNSRVFETEMVMRNSHGNTFWASLTGSCLEFGGIDSLFISTMDITDRKRIHQELERLATTDSLTGIYNRRSFFEFAYKEMRRSVRYKQPFAVMMMDIDNFKAVNDNYGHKFGDNVLRRFTDVVRDSLREEDLLGRLGGEEFCSILVASEEHGGYVVAERIRRRWQEEIFYHQERQLNFTVSIGVSTMISDDETVDDVLERADAGLYSAKRSGRNCVIVHNGEVANIRNERK